MEERGARVRNVNDIAAVRIMWASPEKIRSMSYGEVKKPETRNYRTMKPERDGLFCAKIFGPTNDYECLCGKYKGIKYRGYVCERCGVEVTLSRVRRERMGHIELAYPVVHIWALKSIPSKLSILFDMPVGDLEKIIYFEAWVVIDPKEMAEPREKKRVIKLLRLGKSKKAKLTRSDIEKFFSSIKVETKDRPKVSATLRPSAITYMEIGNIALTLSEDIQELFGSFEPFEPIMREIRVKFEVESVKIDEEKNEVREILLKSEPEFSSDEIETSFLPLKSKQLISDLQRRVLKNVFGDKSFEVDTGAEAIRILLRRLNLEELVKKLKQELSVCKSPATRTKIARRLRLVNEFRKSGNKPEWMVLTVLPVLPPELRPLVPLDGGRFATSDLNDLYRRVINRNNRLKKLMELGAPDIIIWNERRMLQESVDALLDNSKRVKPMIGHHKRPLRSLSDIIRGKHGRFRQNLLGKRMDFSGRSVIVVGPDLRLHQTAIPKDMAIELFKPFIIQKLTEKGYALNVKEARNMIDMRDEKVFEVLDEVLKEKLVLLNRAPTLHRMSIQAFEVLLTEGKAIRIHPLVCTAYNADFDGDQMAVHIPLSIQAQAEARVLMLSTHQLLSPAHGDPIAYPTQDQVMGIFWMTLSDPTDKGAYTLRFFEEGERSDVVEGIFGSPEDVLIAYEAGEVGLHAPVWVRMWQWVEPKDACGSWIVEDVKAEKDVEIDGKVILKRGDVILRRGEIFEGEDVVKLLESAGVRVIKVMWPTRYEYTTVGRVLLYELVMAKVPFWKFSGGAQADPGIFCTRRERAMDRKTVQGIISESMRIAGEKDTVILVDRLKDIGFEMATMAGITLSTIDFPVPSGKERIVREAQQASMKVFEDLERHLITDGEKYNKVVDIWARTSDKIGKEAYREMSRVYVAKVEHNGSLARIIVHGKALGELRRELEEYAGAPSLDGTFSQAVRRVLGGRVTRRLMEEFDREVEEKTIKLTLGDKIRDIALEIRKDGDFPPEVLREKLREVLEESVFHVASAAFDEYCERIGQEKRNYSTYIQSIGRDVISLQPVYNMVLSKARGSKEQVKQLCGMRGLMAKPTGEIIESPITSSLREGHTPLEYFISTHGGRKGLADTALKTAQAGYLTRKLIDVSQDVIVTEEDCGSYEGIEVDLLDIPPDITDPEEKKEYLRKRIRGRASAEDVKVPPKREGEREKIIVEAGEVIDHEKTEEIIREAEEEGTIRSVVIRSILTCRARRGVCRKCYGWDLSTWELVTLGEAVGIIAAQSIGEPGTQLTMRTFHYGGVAAIRGESEHVATENGIVRLRDVKHVETKDGQLIVMNRTGYIEIEPKDRGGRAKRYPLIPYGARILVKDGEEVQAGQTLVAWDPTADPILTHVSGKAVYRDLMEGVTMTTRVDEKTGKAERVVIEPPPMPDKVRVVDPGDTNFSHDEFVEKVKAEEVNKKIKEEKKEPAKYEPAVLKPKIIIMRGSEEVASYSLPVNSVISIENGEEIATGDILARVPKEIARTKDITGGLPMIIDLFEARRPKDAAVITEISGMVKFEKELTRGKRKVKVIPDIPDEKERMQRARECTIPGQRHVIVLDGDRVRAGDPLTDGTPDPKDILRVRGAKGAAEFLVREIKEIYRMQGVDINDKHFEVIVRQMLRKVKIVDPGDTDFLPGELVERAGLEEVNERMRKSKKKPASYEPVLLGITKAALQSESFISAASFQETTRVLCDAAVSGRIDGLQGIKENVIIGKPIPAGTGFPAYRNVGVELMKAEEHELEKIEI